MEASVRSASLANRRHRLLFEAMATLVISLSLSLTTLIVVVEGFATPLKLQSRVIRTIPTYSPSSHLAVSIGLGPENEKGSSVKTSDPAEDDDGDDLKKKFDTTYDPYNSNIIIRGEDGLPLPHITDFEPYRTKRMSRSDKDADAWFTKLLKNSSGDDDDDDGDVSYLGPVSKVHLDRLMTKAELVDEPVLRYGEDEEWTPYVSRRLPTSPLYPAYGLETYGLPVPRRGAEAWRNSDVNGLVSVDYPDRPVGIGTDLDMMSGDRERVISSLKNKGAWLDDNMCTARLVYVNGRFCPSLSKQTDHAKNLDSTHFNSGSVSGETLEFLSRLPDGFTDKLAAEVPVVNAKGVSSVLTSHERLSGPDHSVGKATSQFAINGQMGTAAFAALNSVKAGCVAYVESNVNISGSGSEKGYGMPVLIVNAQTSSAGGGDESSGVAFHPRCLAVANEGSIMSLVQMSIDLDYDAASSLSSRPTLVNGYTQIYVGKDANVTHSFLDESGGIVTPNIEMSDEEFKAEFPDIIDLPREVESQRPALRNVNFQVIDSHIVGDSGSYISSVLELGGTGRSRIAVSTTLLRPGAFASIDGFALSGGAQRTDMRTNIHHVAQGTISRQEQRNMVGGRSTASFRGRIRVEQSAQQTDSKQLSRTVLLSDYARIWATPSLEIVADDVQCTHGATVSDLSEEELFYLRSRGLDRATARNMLMYAFVDEIIKGEGRGVDNSIIGGFDDENGLRRRIIRRLENVVPKGEKYLVGGEFQSS